MTTSIFEITGSHELNWDLIGSYDLKQNNQDVRIDLDSGVINSFCEYDSGWGGLVNEKVSATAWEVVKG